MKKLMIAVFALILVITVSGCSIVGDALSTLDLEGLSTLNLGELEGLISSEGGIDISSIFSGTAKIDLNNLTEEHKQEIVNKAKEQNVEVCFNDDGTVTFINEDGSKATQNADGTWTIVNVDGTTGQYGGSWPDNKFTRAVPKPDFGKLVGASTDTNGFSVAISGASVEQIRAYAELLKDSGFTDDINESDQSLLGITVYAFEGTNESGYRVKVSYAASFIGLTISK